MGRWLMISEVFSSPNDSDRLLEWANSLPFATNQPASSPLSSLPQQAEDTLATWTTVTSQHHHVWDPV